MNSPSTRHDTPHATRQARRWRKTLLVWAAAQALAGAAQAGNIRFEPIQSPQLPGQGDRQSVQVTALNNGGLVRVGSGRAEILRDVNNGPRGLIHAHDGADLTVQDALRNVGELRVSGGSRIVYAGPVSGKGGLVGGSQHDHIDFVGSVLFEASSFLRISLINGFTPQVGNSFALFSFIQAPVGNFEDFYLPSLSAGLHWDVSQLASTGVLSVLGTAPVPEPQTWALTLLGLPAVTWRLHLKRGR